MSELDVVNDEDYKNWSLESLFEDDDWTTGTPRTHQLVQAALKILIENPAKAKEPVSLGVIGLTGLPPHYDAWEVPPLNHFLAAGWLDEKTFWSVFNLNPDGLVCNTVKDWSPSSRAYHLSSWHLAFGSEGAGSCKGILTHLLNIHVDNGGPKGLWGHKGQYPFGYFITRALSKPRSAAEYAYILEICDILWNQEDWNQDPPWPRSKYDWEADARMTPLIQAVRANCQPLIQYFLSKLSNFFWQDAEIEFVGDAPSAIPAARGLMTILPKVHRLRLVFKEVPETPDHESGFTLVMNALQQTTYIFTLVVVLPRFCTMAMTTAWQSFFHECQFQIYITVCGSEPMLGNDTPNRNGVANEYFDAMINGLKKNQIKLDAVLLSGFRSLDSVRFGALLECGPTQVSVSNSTIYEDFHEYPNADTKPGQKSNLICMGYVSFETVTFHGDSFLSCCEKISTHVCALQLLNLSLCSRGRNSALQHTGGIVFLLEKLPVEQLSLKEGHSTPFIDFSAFAKYLERNNSLKKLLLTFSSNSAALDPAVFERILGPVLKNHNTTLEEVITRRYPATTSNTPLIQYYTDLNRFGRQTMRSLESTPQDFLDKLIKFYESERTPDFVPILYGLLRETPTLWIKSITDWSESRKRNAGQTNKRLGRR